MQTQALKELRLQKWNKQLKETEKELLYQMRKANNGLANLSDFKGFKKVPKNFATIQRKAMNRAVFLIDRENRLMEKIRNIDSL